MRQHIKIYRRQKCHVEICNVRFIWHAHLRAEFSWRKPPEPRIMRNLWSNSREETHGNEKRKGDDNSYPKGIVALLRETARKGFPDLEEVNNPMTAPQDYGIRQSR